MKSGITTDGGYAEVMIAEARALATIPDELTPVEAAPLLCAGITTYNALRNAGLRAGDLVGIPTPRYATSSWHGPSSPEHLLMKGYCGGGDDPVCRQT